MSEVSNFLNVCLDDYLKLSACTDPERGRALGEDQEIGVVSKGASGIDVAVERDRSCVKA